MVKCPNKSLPEWKELERLCPDTAYVVWDTFPEGIDKAPNGEPSKLFSDLLEHFNGNRDAAIQAKAKTATDAFKSWFGDWVRVANNSLGNLKGNNDVSEIINNDGTINFNRLEEITNEYFKNADISLFKKGRKTLRERQEKHFDINGNPLEVNTLEHLINVTKSASEIDIKEELKPILILAALLHDIAKPFHGGQRHGFQSVDVINSVFKGNISPLVKFAVRHHMLTLEESKEFTINDAKRIIQDAIDNNLNIQDAIDILLALNTSDIMMGQKPSDIDRYSGKTKKETIEEEIPIKRELLELAAKNLSDNKASKVVDSNGEPLVVYYGKFNEFTIDTYNKLTDAVNEAKQGLDSKQVIREATLYNEMSGFTDTATAINWLLENKYISDELIPIAKILAKHGTKLVISDISKEKAVGGYVHSKKTVNIYKGAFSSNNNLVETLLHETMHYYTGKLYETNSSFKSFVDAMQNRYRKLAEKDSDASIDRYGLTANGNEFLNEIMTNKDFIDYLKSKENSLWERFKRFVAKLFYNNSEKSVTVDEIRNSVTNMLEKISNRMPLGEYYNRESRMMTDISNKMSDESVASMTAKSRLVSAKIMQGIQSRIKALNQYGSRTMNQVMRLKQEMTKLQEMLEKNEDKQAIIEFITHASTESKAPLGAVNAAYEEYMNTGKFSLRNDQLVQLQKDFIGFYEPIIEDINNKLYVTGYFDDMDATDKAFIDNQMTLLTKAFTSIKGKYDDLLATRFGEILLKYGEAVNSPTIKAYVNDNINTTNTDLSFYSTFIGGMRFVKDEALRLIAKKVTDTQNNIERATIQKASEFLPKATKVKDWQQFYEKDNKGKKTGYLVRDRNYGQYYNDYKEFMDSLGEAPISDEKELMEWNAKRNKWLAEHVERRYTPEYYDLFNHLGFAANEARDKIQLDISSILSENTDKFGEVHIENISTENWNKLQTLYEQKRMLALHYYPDGMRKSGIDEEIADQLSELNKSLYEHLHYKPNIKKFEEAAKKKKATISPESYEKWYERSTRIAYSEEFQEKLKGIDHKYYNEEYEKLAEERRELNGMYRNIHDFRINVKKMPDSVKDRIRVLDKRMADIASSFPKQQTDFSKVAHIETSAYYKEEKNAALDRDKVEPGFYKKWSEENHYVDSKGVLRAYSYYNIMIPNKENDVVIVPSREYSEVDTESPYWNKNFDIESQEYLQPKKSLYDNSKAYKKIQEDKNAKELYDAIIEMMEESNNKLVFMKRKNNFKLPQISGGAWAHMTGSDSMVKGIGEYLKDKVSVRQDDIDYNYENQTVSPDGRRLTTVPTHYVKMLDNPATITNNLAGAIVKYYSMAENYKQKLEILPEMELLQRQIEQREYQPGYDRTGIIGGINESVDAIRRMRTIPKQTQATNATTRLNQYYNNNLFGEKYKPIIVGKVNLVKVFVELKSYATLVNLSLSPFIAFANVAGSMHQHVVEAITGVFYTPKTAAIAFRNCVYHYGKILMNAGNYKHSDKLLSLMNMNQVSRETDNMYERLNYNKFARFAMNHLWYGMMSAGDFFTKSQILASVYLNVKYVQGIGFITRDDYIRSNSDNPSAKSQFDSLNTPTLWDIYEEDGTDVKIKDKYKEYAKYVTPELTNKVTNIVKYLAQRADGMMDASEKNIAQANAIIGFAFMHKNFILNALEDRVLKPTAYNYMTERMDEAQYKTAMTSILNVVKYLSDLRKYHSLDIAERGEKPKMSKLEDYQRYNLKRMKNEVSLLIAYLLISMALQKWDKDKDTWASNAILYGHERATYEGWNLYNPWDVVNSFKTISPAMSSLENMKTAVLALEFWNWESNFDKHVKYGPYKGKSKFERAVWKSTPFKNILEATDPKQKYKYLKGQLQ